MTIKVLLQTTIAPGADDWSVARFSLLAALLRQERDESGQPLFDVTTRDRDPLGAPDTLLSNLDRSDYDQLVRSSFSRVIRTKVRVSAPPGARARVIARGRSKATGARFNIAVAFEADGKAGRAIAQSTFHHFADYNWDPRVGAPSFVDEPPGDAISAIPRRGLLPIDMRETFRSGSQASRRIELSVPAVST